MGRISGTTRQNVVALCRRRLAPACHGTRIDLDHPAVQRYLAEKAAAPPRADPMPLMPGRPAAVPRPPTDENAPKNIEDVTCFERYTLPELATLFPQRALHPEWMSMRRKQTQIRERELKNAELEAKLIPRDAVRAVMFAAIDHAHGRLAREAPKMLAAHVYKMARNAEPVEKTEEYVRATVSSLLQEIKDTAAFGLRVPPSGKGAPIERGRTRGLR